MTHKQFVFGKDKRSQKLKHVEEEYESGNAPRRAVLPSYDDVDRMAVESARARLINHLVSKSDDHPPRQFASYQAPTRCVDPPYSIRSNKVPIPKVQQVIPAYPSLISSAPRWTAYSKPVQKSETDLTMNQKYTCRCRNCPSPDCPARRGNTLKPRRFKNNIMTFSDQCTMTVMLNDVSCGCTPSPSKFDCSNALVPCDFSMVAVKDNPKIPEIYNSNFSPVPILKKGARPIGHDCGQKKYQNEHDNIDLSRIKSLKRFSEKEKDEESDCNDEVLMRKNIYNEGVSDVTFRDHSRLKKINPPSTCSESESSGSISDDEDNIPFSHRTESKYHKHCKVPSKTKFVYDSGTQISKHRVLADPRIIPKTYPTNPCKRCQHQQQTIKLPKKVLASEKVTDSHANKLLQNKMSRRKN